MRMKKENITRTFTFIILGLFLFSFCASVVSAADIVVDDDLSSEEVEWIRTVIDTPIVKYVFGHPGKSIQTFKSAYGAAYDEMPMGDVSAIIIHIVFFLMLAFAFSDILGGFLPFQNKYVPWVLGVGLTIIFANLGVIPLVLIGLAKVTVWVGTWAIFLSMMIAFVAFVAVAFFGNLLKVKLISAKISAAAAAGGARTSAAISNLAAIEKTLEKSG